MLLHTLLASRTRVYGPLMWFLLMFALFLFSYCCYANPRVPHIVLVRATLLSQFAAPSLVPLLIMYYRRSRLIGRKEHPLEMMWVIVPSVLFTASLVLYLTAGEPAVAGFSSAKDYADTPLYAYHIVTDYVFRAVMTIEAIWLGVYIIILAIKEKFRLGRIMPFLFKGESIKLTGMHTFFVLPAYFILIATFLLPRGSLYDRPVLMIVFSLLLTACIVGFSYTALFAARRTITRKEMRNAMRYNYNPDNKARVVEDMLNDLLDDAEEDALRRLQERLNVDLHIDEFRSELPFVERSAIAEKIFNAVSNDWGEDKMLNQFQHLMRDEMMFLQPGLSLEDVADRMGTNKFYVSKLVNNTYNLGFPELINILRVDYAEQYIMIHRNAKQNEIATQCGFVSASSFNTIFKKVTGVTPKVWVAAKEHSEQ